MLVANCHENMPCPLVQLPKRAGISPAEEHYGSYGIWYQQASARDFIMPTIPNTLSSLAIPP